MALATRLTTAKQPGMQMRSPMTPSTSSSVSPMATMAIQGLGTSAPSTQMGQRNTMTPPVANPMSNQFQFTPEQYSKDVEGSYAEQLSQNAKDAQAAQGISNNYQASLQRRNASNAAIGGYSVGGGGFLAGQANAGMEGLSNMLDTQRRYSDQAVGIRQGQANYRAGVDQRNNGRQNDMAYQDYIYNRGRTDKLADDKSAADATSFGNQVTSAAGDTAASLAQYGINFEGGVGHGVGWAEAMPLLTAIKTAKTPEELSRAQAAMGNFLTRRAAARAQYKTYKAQADKDGQPDQYGSEDAFLKAQGW